MPKITATEKLKRDLMTMKKEPDPHIVAEQNPTNILEVHYMMRGPEDSLYEGGYYHGKLIFPNDYPFKPPSVIMITPNGRFRPNMRLGLSLSDYHPETWSPLWSVSKILIGLLCFMLETEHASGAINTSDDDKRLFAKDSGAYNIKSEFFCNLFPEVVKEIKDKIDGKYTTEPNDIDSV